MSVTLDFCTPKSYAEFESPNATHAIAADKPGIYMWGFKNGGVFYPYYVGRRYSTKKKKGTVLIRVKSHYASIIKGGTYMMFEEEFYQDLKTNLGLVKSVNRPYEELGDLERLLVYRNDEAFLRKKYEREFIRHKKLAEFDQLIDEKKAKQALKEKPKKIDISAKEVDAFLPASMKITPLIQKKFKKNELFVSYACVPDEEWGNDYDKLKRIIVEAENATKHKLALFNINVVSKSEGPICTDPNELEWIQLNKIGLPDTKLVQSSSL